MLLPSFTSRSMYACTRRPSPFGTISSTGCSNVCINRSSSSVSRDSGNSCLHINNRANRCHSGILTWTITACTAVLAFWQGQSLQYSMARYMMTKLLYVKPRSLPRGPSKETASHCSLFLPCCVRAYNNTLLTQCHYCMLLRSFPEVFAYVAASCFASALALVAPLPPAPPESVCLSL